VYTQGGAKLIPAFRKKVKGGAIALNGSHFRATEHHLLYGIPQCYLPPTTGERAPP